MITLFQLNESKAWFIEVNLFCVGQNDQQARARTHTNTHTYIHTHTNTHTYTHTHTHTHTYAAFILEEELIHY